MRPPIEQLLPYVDNKVEAAVFFDVSERTIARWLEFYDLYKPRENFGSGKLNLKIAKEIRLKHKNGSKIKDLAKEYSVTVATIGRIIKNVTYREKIHNSAQVVVIYNN